MRPADFRCMPRGGCTCAPPPAGPSDGATAWERARHGRQGRQRLDASPCQPVEERERASHRVLQPRKPPTAAEVATTRVHAWLTTPGDPPAGAGCAGEADPGTRAKGRAKLCGRISSVRRLAGLAVCKASAAALPCSRSAFGADERSPVAKPSDIRGDYMLFRCVFPKTGTGTPVDSIGILEMPTVFNQSASRYSSLG